MLFPLSRRGPAREMQKLQEQLDSLFASSSGVVHSYPPVNVWTSDEGAILTTEIPGVEAENIDISVQGQTLVLRGSRTRLEPKQNESLIRRERLTGSFARSVELPFRVQAEKVEAKFNKGLLTLVLPRAEADKPRKIAVKAA